MITLDTNDSAFTERDKECVCVYMCVHSEVYMKDIAVHFDLLWCLLGSKNFSCLLTSHGTYEC